MITSCQSLQKLATRKAAEFARGAKTAASLFLKPTEGDLIFNYS